MHKINDYNNIETKGAFIKKLFQKGGVQRCNKNLEPA